MNQMTAFNTASTLTMSSLQIAELVESNHADVRRSIERLSTRGVIALPPLAEVPNIGPGPKTVKAYLVGKRDSYVVVAQLSPEFTARLVDRWQELEEQVQAKTPVLPDFTNPAIVLVAQITFLSLVMPFSIRLVGNGKASGSAQKLHNNSTLYASRGI